jgi:glutathione peroxidase
MNLVFVVFIFSLAFNSMAATFFDLKGTTIEGKPLSFKDFKGKTILVVNIASQCGYTPQLTDLENLYQKYKTKNFVLIGFPTNDFGGQTPESDSQMKEFCSRKYNVTFPLMKKAEVLGAKRQDVYQYFSSLKDKKFSEDVKWNFEKFLISKDGLVIERFGSSVKPMDPSLTKVIETNLK